MGKIEEIIIKGLDVQIIVVTAHRLILIIIVDKNFLSEDAREEAEKALEHFYTLYKDEIATCVDISRFTSFKRLLYKQIEDFFENKKNSSTKQDFGFFTEAIRKMRQQKST